MSITQNKFNQKQNINSRQQHSLKPSLNTNQKAVMSNTTSTRLYFYTNALFMGTTKSLQRISTGLLLFHDNTSAIVSYNTNS